MFRAVILENDRVTASPTDSTCGKILRFPDFTKKAIVPNLVPCSQRVFKVLKELGVDIHNFF